mmetsp:Transcript_14194/g.31536  ORF Transcript_14194/g.31536 Transcript_14194/m.31536 type:complete len:259 (-) Transcript_14194:1197-1973(-)
MSRRSCERHQSIKVLASRIRRSHNHILYRQDLCKLLKAPGKSLPKTQCLLSFEISVCNRRDRGRCQTLLGCWTTLLCEILLGSDPPASSHCALWRVSLPAWSMSFRLGFCFRSGKSARLQDTATIKTYHHRRLWLPPATWSSWLLLGKRFRTERSPPRGVLGFASLRVKIAQGRCGGSRRVGPLQRVQRRATAALRAFLAHRLWLHMGLWRQPARTWRECSQMMVFQSVSVGCQRPLEQCQENDRRAPCTRWQLRSRG